jgi:hypothetical protein
LANATQQRFGVLLVLGIALVLSTKALHGATLKALPEWRRPDPFGQVVTADVGQDSWLHQVKIKAARGGYASFHVVAEDAAGGKLSVDLPLQVDLYREWFHWNVPDKKYYPDALIPVASQHAAVRSAEAPSIAGQKADAFFVDVWIPELTKPGTYRGSVRVEGTGATNRLSIEIEVLAWTVPAEDAISLDNNSYGVDWLHAQYPKLFLAAHDDLAVEAKLIHAHHALFYENRGIFHQLGYSHLGSVQRGFAPALAGTGKSKHVVDWTDFDRNFGPLLDGSVFTSTRRGARPIPYLYLPINAAWPANELWWGEPGYDVEFRNVVSEMEKHFAERGWTHTRFEMFFNQKKRYKGFAWDGDEIRFPKDEQYLLKFASLLHESLPKSTPVQVVFRADASWQIEREVDDLKGAITMWTLGSGMVTWYEDKLPALREQGDVLWTYGGTPPVSATASGIAIDPMRTWVMGVDGFVRWLTVSPGPDPWFHLTGGEETLIYPGERFGVEGPLPSLRLKLQRNCLQDIAILRAKEKDGDIHVKRDAVLAFNGTDISDWKNTKTTPPVGDVMDWTNADIGDALKPYEKQFESVDAAAWERVHALALQGGSR